MQYLEFEQNRPSQLADGAAHKLCKCTTDNQEIGGESRTNRAFSGTKGMHSPKPRDPLSCRQLPVSFPGCEFRPLHLEHDSVSFLLRQGKYM